MLYNFDFLISTGQESNYIQIKNPLCKINNYYQFDIMLALLQLYASMR